MKGNWIRQGDLRIASRLRMSFEEVEALDDARWSEALAAANWLDDQEADRVAEGLLRAIAAMVRG